MKAIGGLLVFVLVFLGVGVGMHYALYEKMGVFVWSMEKDAQSGSSKFVRTTLESAAGARAAAAAPDESAGGEDTLESAPAPEPASPGEAKPKRKAGEFPLFNGKDLGAWEVTQYGGEGEVFVNEDGNMEFGFGAVITGVNWGEAVPATSNYEITLDAMKLDGTDFFCALTFPVKDSHATFVIGGWGGGVVGISCVDDLNASENETMNIEGFEDDVWYKIRVRVTDDKLNAWIDDEEKVDLELEDRKISLLPGDIELSVPIGIASFQTRSQYRNIVWRNLPAGE
ncbi:MAG: DUF1080 domain-containing protein [Verrucomicrobiales bacterium]|nr:DUF1080 domain-containing protein [Verrucomicrobiales bacterium]